MLLMVNHLHTQKDVYISPSSAPGLFMHYCIIINIIPNTLINPKMTRKHILDIHDWVFEYYACAHTHTHRHTKNESCSDEKAVFSEWTLWPILHVQEPILFYQALTDFLFNKTHLDTQHWPRVHYYNTATLPCETASFAMILDQMPQRKSWPQPSRYIRYIKQKA